MNYFCEDQKVWEWKYFWCENEKIILIAESSTNDNELIKWIFGFQLIIKWILSYEWELVEVCNGEDLGQGVETFFSWYFKNTKNLFRMFFMKHDTTLKHLTYTNIFVAHIKINPLNRSTDGIRINPDKRIKTNEKFPFRYSTHSVSLLKKRFSHTFIY